MLQRLIKLEKKVRGLCCKLEKFIKEGGSGGDTLDSITSEPGGNTTTNTITVGGLFSGIDTHMSAIGTDGLFTKTNDNDVYGIIKSDLLTSQRIYQEPDRDGTLALDLDIVDVPTTSRIMLATDVGKNLQYTSTLDTPARTYTVVTNAVAPAPINSIIKLTLIGSGANNLYNNLTVGGAGITFIAPFGLTAYKDGELSLRKIATNTWYVYSSPFQFIGSTVSTLWNFTAAYIYADFYVAAVNHGLTSSSGALDFFVGAGEAYWKSNGHIRDESGVALSHADDLTRQSDVDTKIYNKNKAGNASADALTAVDNTILVIDFTTQGAALHTDYTALPVALNADASTLLASGYWISNRTITSFQVNFNTAFLTVVDFSWTLTLH